MHTVTGCYADNTTVPTGELTFNNCDHGVEANKGCTYVDPRNASYGADFAAGGGGVYAAELASDGISVWFFAVRPSPLFLSSSPSRSRADPELVPPQRADVPADLSVSTPDPTTWGRPMAYYPSSTCSINQYFAPQQLTINIALCGDCASSLFLHLDDLLKERAH